MKVLGFLEGCDRVDGTGREHAFLQDVWNPHLHKTLRLRPFLEGVKVPGCYRRVARWRWGEISMVRI